MVSDAKNSGAECLVGENLKIIFQFFIFCHIAYEGGEPHPAGDLFYKPTILTNVKENMELFEGEIFGPVVSIKKFATGITTVSISFTKLKLKYFLEKEAMDIANNCRTGLAGYFYSNDIRQCWRVAKSLETGKINNFENHVQCV